MNFLKSLFQPKSKVPDDFKKSVEKAIVILEENSSIDNDKVVELFERNGFDKQVALEIFFFLPIAFVRTWLTDISWPDTYFDFKSNENKKQRKYQETESYCIILEVTQNYFSSSPSPESIIKIAGRSAEYNAINHLFLEFSDYDLKEVKISSTVIPSTLIR